MHLKLDPLSSPIRAAPAVGLAEEEGVRRQGQDDRGGDHGEVQGSDPGSDVLKPAGDWGQPAQAGSSDTWEAGLETVAVARPVEQQHQGHDGQHGQSRQRQGLSPVGRQSDQGGSRYRQQQVEVEQPVR